MGTLADSIANAMLDAVARAVPFSTAAIWIQLHIGDPTSTGLANPAANTTRLQAVFGTAATARAIANTTALTWSSVPATEAYSHATAWSAPTAGTLIGTHALPSPVSVIAGDTATVPIGAVTFTL